MDETTRPKASPERAKHLLKELKALAEGGHIQLKGFSLIDPPPKIQPQDKPDLGGLSWEEWLEKGRRFERRLEQVRQQIREKNATSSEPPSDSTLP